MSSQSFWKGLAIRIGGSSIGLGMIALVVFLGDLLDLGFLQSKGGVFVATIVLMEITFFGLLIGFVVFDEFTG